VFERCDDEKEYSIKVHGGLLIVEVIVVKGSGVNRNNPGSRDHSGPDTLLSDFPRRASVASASRRSIPICAKGKRRRCSPVKLAQKRNPCVHRYPCTDALVKDQLSHDAPIFSFFWNVLDGTRTIKCPNWDAVCLKRLPFLGVGIYGSTGRCTGKLVGETRRASSA
jgi:hypothetical protein